MSDELEQAAAPAATTFRERYGMTREQLRDLVYARLREQREGEARQENDASSSSATVPTPPARPNYPACVQPSGRKSVARNDRP